MTLLNPNSDRMVGLEWQATGQNSVQLDSMSKALVQPVYRDGTGLVPDFIYVMCSKVVGSPYYKLMIVDSDASDFVPQNQTYVDLVPGTMDWNEDTAFLLDGTGPPWTVLDAIDDTPGSPDDGIGYIYKDGTTGGVYKSLHVTKAGSYSTLNGKMINRAVLIMRARTTYTSGTAWPITPFIYDRKNGGANNQYEYPGNKIIPTTDWATYYTTWYYDPVGRGYLTVLGQRYWSPSNGANLFYDGPTTSGDPVTSGWGLRYNGTLEDITQMFLRIYYADQYSDLSEYDLSYTSNDWSRSPVGATPTSTTTGQRYIIILPIKVDSQNYIVIPTITPNLDDSHNASLYSMTHGMIDGETITPLNATAAITVYDYGNPYAKASSVNVSSYNNAINSVRSIYQLVSSNAAISPTAVRSYKAMLCAPRGTPTDDLTIEVLSADGVTQYGEATIHRKSVPTSPALITGTFDNDITFSGSTQYRINFRSTCTEAKTYRVVRLGTGGDSDDGQVSTLTFGGITSYALQSGDSPSSTYSDLCVAVGHAPDAVTGLTSTIDETLGSIDLDWDDTALGGDFLEYRVYRKRSSDDYWQLVATLSTSEWTDRMPPLGKDVDYAVTQVDIAYAESIRTEELNVSVGGAFAHLGTDINDALNMWIIYQPPYEFFRPRIERKIDTWESKFARVEQASYVHGYEGKINTELWDYVGNTSLTALEQYDLLEDIRQATDIPYIWFRTPDGKYVIPVKIIDVKKRDETLERIMIDMTLVQVAEAL